MGTFVGHILPGTGFLLLGLWHLGNVLGMHLRSPWSYRTRTWYSPEGLGRRFRHVELYFIMVGACGSIAGELLPDRFWSVTTHLNNFEHSTISLTLLLYAGFALAVDVLEIDAPQGWLHATAALVLGQELLLFHFHSADHMGLEGHYHWLLQLPVAAGILALLVEVVVHHLPVVAVLRSMSFVLQGSWFILMGCVLWTPSLVPEGCYIADNHVDCPTPNSLMAAKSLANLEFAWLLSAIFLLTGSGLVAASVYCRNNHAARRTTTRTSYQRLDDRLGSKDPGPAKIDLDGMERGEEEDSSSAGSSSSQTSLELQAIGRVDLER